MNNLSPSQKYEQKTIKSALKKELPLEDQIFRRYDRKGRQITIGSKYEVTIDEQVKYLVPLCNMAPKSRSKSPVQLQNFTRSPLTKSPLTKSPMIEKSETAATVFKQQPSISSKILEFNEQEEQTLKNLESKFQKNKKIGKKQKQCCLIF